MKIIIKHNLNEWIMTKRAQWLIGILLCTLLTAHSLPLFDDGAQDVRYMNFAMHDEYLITYHVWNMVDQGSLYHGFRVYPGLYPYTVAAMRAIIGPDSLEFFHIIALRFLSLIISCFALLLTLWLFSRIKYGLWAALILSFWMAWHPETILWASRIHPDALLLLFNQASLAFLMLGAERRDDKYIKIAALLAGFSAGTKLFGFFIIVAMSIWLIFIYWHNRRHLIRLLLITSALFLAAFLVVNPYLFVDAAKVITGLLSQHKRNIHGTSSLWQWWPLLWGSRGFGIVGAFLVLFGIVDGIWKKDRTTIPVLIFVAVYSSYLFGAVRIDVSRYAIPMMWPLIFLGLRSMVRIYIENKMIRPMHYATMIAMVVLLICFAVVDIPRMHEAHNDDIEHYNCSLTATEIAFGEHLRSYAARANGIVLSRYYIYVPREIGWLPDWSLPVKRLKRPDDILAVVVTKELQWDKDNEQRFRNGEFGFVWCETIYDHEIFVPKSRAKLHGCAL